MLRLFGLSVVVASCSLDLAQTKIIQIQKTNAMKTGQLGYYVRLL